MPQAFVSPSGRQTGEYFGAALAAVDINGDGIEELVVGAPLFTNYNGLAKTRTTVGTVFSFLFPSRVVDVPLPEAL